MSIPPFIISVSQPYVFFKRGGKVLRDVWNRNAQYYLATPKKAGKPIEIKEDGGIKFELSHDEYNKNRFAMFHYPCLIYNERIKSFITKDFLNGEETGAFAEHLLLNTNQQIEEQTIAMRNFARYIGERLKPIGNIFQQPLTWIVIVIALVILAAIFAPKIIEMLGGSFQSAGGAMQSARQAAITPAG